MNSFNNLPAFVNCLSHSFVDACVPFPEFAKASNYEFNSINFHHVAVTIDFFSDCCDENIPPQLLDTKLKLLRKFYNVAAVTYNNADMSDILPAIRQLFEVTRYLILYTVQPLINECYSYGKMVRIFVSQH
jgi:hypothetical protein